MIEKNGHNVEFIFHVGARTDTAEFDQNIFNRLNLNFSKMICDASINFNIPLIYASSAATYGIGENGFDDNHTTINKLQPLNPYGESKNNFDKWIIEKKQKPNHWYGLKFFNVYGPNEYHKTRMASVIYHFYNQILSTKSISLFKSHHKEYQDGNQIRDFIYVKDVIKVMFFLFENYKNTDSGIYNLGTGKARTFNDLSEIIFETLRTKKAINYIDIPIDIRDKYQYFTEANMEKLKNIGYNENFISLEDGIVDYIQNYLIKGNYY